MRPEGTRHGKKVSWPLLVALFLIPLLVVGSLLGLIRGGDKDKVEAAIVNLDKGTEIEGQFVPMGRQLAAEMMEREGENITWILADAKSGDEGIRTGQYAALVTIPDDFSKRAMSFAANDADVAEKARIDVVISDNAPARDVKVAQEIARIATGSLNDMLTSQYLDGIYLGFNEVGTQFGQIVDGANQLKDGSGQLADGMGEASDGAGELADGMDQLVAGSGKLNDGGGQLADGSTELGSGARELADGAGQLDAGVQQMAGKMPQLVDGVQQLTDGAGLLLPGVRQYTDGTAKVIDGVAQLEDGLDQVVTGLDSANMDFSELDQLVDGSQQLADGADELADGADQLADGIDQVVTPLEELDGVITDEMIEGAAGLKEQAAKLGTFVTDADEKMQGYADGTLPPPAELTAMADQLKAQFQCPTPDDAEACAQLQASYEQGVDAALFGGFQQGAEQGTKFLHSTDPTTGKTYIELADEASTGLAGPIDQLVTGLEQAQQLIPGLIQLRDGSRELADGSRELATGNQQLADGIDLMATEMPKQITAQMGELRDGLGQLRDGAGQIVDQSQPLVSGGRQLADGSDQLLGGVQQLNGQVGQLPAGVNQLADGTSKLASGAGQLADGVNQYSDGVWQFVDGVWQYTDGVGQAASGAGELADGMTQLDDGVGELDEGVGTFAGKLAEGKDQVPHYSESDRATLTDVVSGPIASDGSLMSSSKVALTALILAAGVWLAALAAFTITRPVPSDVVMSRATSATLWARTVGMPTAIVVGVGAVLGVIGGVVLSLGLGRMAGLVLILAGLGGVFSLVHHALAGWLGHVGRGLSLVLLAITVALGLSSGVPGWLDVAATLSPLQSGMLVTRSWLSGAAVLTSLAAMVIVAAFFAVLSWLAIAMRRQLTPANFNLRHA